MARQLRQVADEPTVDEPAEPVVVEVPAEVPDPPVLVPLSPLAPVAPLGVTVEELLLPLIQQYTNVAVSADYAATQWIVTITVTPGGDATPRAGSATAGEFLTAVRGAIMGLRA